MKDTICICTTLRQAALTATEAYDEALAPTGLKVTMYRLLHRLSQEDGLNITQLAKRVGLDRSTIGRNLKVLEREGMIEFEGGKDERARVIKLTELGLEKMRAGQPLWAEAQRNMREKLGAETDNLLELLQVVKE